MHKFFAFLSRMKYIKRWSLMRSGIEENVMEHSQQVAVIAHSLAAINNKILKGDADIFKTVMYAQYHEASEVITGDLPSPIKYYNADIKAAYKNLERVAVDKLITTLPDELKEEYEKYLKPDIDSHEYKLTKYADKLSAYIKCAEEVMGGNGEFKKAKAGLWEELRAFKSLEVDYFMDNFLPAYLLTLDELE